MAFRKVSFDHMIRGTLLATLEWLFPEAIPTRLPEADGFDPIPAGKPICAVRVGRKGGGGRKD